MTAKQRAHVRNAAAGFVCLVCLLWLAVTGLQPSAVARQGAAPPGSVPTNQVELLQEVALLANPASLAVAGMTPAHAQSALVAVAMENSAVIAALRQSREQAEQHSEALAHAQEVLFRGGATPERLAAREGAQASFDAAVASHRNAQAELRTALAHAVRDSVGAEAMSLAVRWNDNALRKVPDHFKALDLGDEAWRVLEAAWRQVERGEELSSAQAAALGAAQSSPVAMLAQQRLVAGLPALSDLVVDAATGQPSAQQ